MRKTPTIAAIGLTALALAGCNGGSEKATTDQATTSAQKDAAENDATATPASPQATPSSAETAAPSPSPNATDSTGPVEARIPRTLRGRWGLVPADCTSTRGDNKGLLVVSGETLRFYESVGTLETVVERDDSRIVGDFGFTGEGMTWKRRMVLDGQDDGQTLIRREQGADAMPGPLRYRRCA